MNLIFSPTLDKGLKNPLFPRPIRHLLNDDNDIPIIIGYTTHEYIIFLESTIIDHKLYILYMCSKYYIAYFYLYMYYTLI